MRGAPAVERGKRARMVSDPTKKRFQPSRSKKGFNQNCHPHLLDVGEEARLEFVHVAADHAAGGGLLLEGAGADGNLGGKGQCMQNTMQVRTDEISNRREQEG